MTAKSEDNFMKEPDFERIDEAVLGFSKCRASRSLITFLL